MNSVVRQLWEQNTDVVMVDTGNSYEGLCEYVGGKYIKPKGRFFWSQCFSCAIICEFV